MIDSKTRQALAAFEASIARATGDKPMARRFRQEMEHGRAPNPTLLARLERTVARRTGDKRLARALRTQVAAAAAPQQAPKKPPASKRAEPLIDGRVVGWARNPGPKGATLVVKDTGCPVTDAGNPIVEPSMIVRAKSFGPVSLMDFLAHARRPDVEGEIPWMYQDGGGNVTVGIGHLIPDLAEAERLAKNYSFSFMNGGAPVMEGKVSHVRRAFNAVRTATGATPGEAKTYAGISQIVMTPASIRQLFLDDATEFLRQIRSSTYKATFGDYDTYPKEAKLAILDMVFNTGASGLINAWPRFVAAMRHRDWLEAEGESRDRKASLGRQAQMLMWLKEARRKEPYFIRSPIAKFKKPCLGDLGDLLRKFGK